MSGDHTLQVLLYKQEDWWIAQCLEYDIAAQAKSTEDVLYEISRLFVSRFVAAEEVGIKDPLESLPPAPEEFWKMYKKGIRAQPDRLRFQSPSGTPPIPPLEFALSVA